MPSTEDTFVRDLQGQDELGVVIRAHIHIEAHLNELVEKLVAEKERLKKANLEYHQLVHLAIALGLKEEHAGPLLALGNLRNTFAHQIDTALTKDRVDALYKSFSPSDKELAQHVYVKTNKQLKVNESSRSLRDLDPKDQFVLLATAIRGMLRAAIAQLEEAKK
jgi:hypothetical protein